MVRSRRTATAQLFADVTIGVSGSVRVDEAHAFADEAEEAIRQRFGGRSGGRGRRGSRAHRACMRTCETRRTLYLTRRPSLPCPMASRPARSLKHEYELYVEQEVEHYKEQVPRSVLLGIGDEAVSVLARQPQFALTELVLCEEVDRLIVRRLRLPSYAGWRKQRLKQIAELKRPEHLGAGLAAAGAVVREVRPSSERCDGQVLVAGATDETQALYLAANGCHVTALGPEPDAVERVMAAAVQVGLTERVHALVGTLSSWLPDGPLAAVIVAPAALAGLTAEERARIIAVLQTATIDGGIHLVETMAPSGKRTMTLDELRSTYRGWDVSVERTEQGGKPKLFLAKKGAA
jgi:hypothetical protein